MSRVWTLNNLQLFAYLSAKRRFPNLVKEKFDLTSTKVKLTSLVFECLFVWLDLEKEIWLLYKHQHTYMMWELRSSPRAGLAYKAALARTAYPASQLPTWVSVCTYTIMPQAFCPSDHLSAQWPLHWPVSRPAACLPACLPAGLLFLPSRLSHGNSKRLHACLPLKAQSPLWPRGSYR